MKILKCLLGLIKTSLQNLTSQISLTKWITVTEKQL